MGQGKVKWFDNIKGYGFIEPNTGNGDIFVNISEVEKAGYNSLSTDQVVSYELQTKNGKSSAINLKLI